MHCELMLFTDYFRAWHSLKRALMDGRLKPYDTHTHTHTYTDVQLVSMSLHTMVQSLNYAINLGQHRRQEHRAVRQSPFHLTELLSFHRRRWTIPDRFPQSWTLVRSSTPARYTHKHMSVHATDPSWCLIPPHFLRPLLLSNWGGCEYNYGENHPGLMWGRINGIKKIICWPSGPGAVWGWEGNLKQREEEIGGL